jgi:hypothetical protein
VTQGFCRGNFISPNAGELKMCKAASHKYSSTSNNSETSKREYKGRIQPTRMAFPDSMNLRNTGSNSYRLRTDGIMHGENP